MTRTVVRRAWRAAWLAGATLAGAALATPAAAALQTTGFRAVGVAHAAYPMSALAVAPDGRLFAAIQARGQTSGSTPGQAEIRVYSAFPANDGSVLDEGALWATVPEVRATTNEEGLLGLALAPDFATSRLVYVYLTTTANGVDQQVRVFRENAAGTGDDLGPVLGALEPPAESTARNGGALAFGADGCLYVGVGDNGGNGRWNAQLLLGTDAIQSSENTALCTNVCLGPSLYPPRSVANDGALNHAGKVLRLAVAGASPAQPGPAAPLASQPFVFGAGLRNPVGFGVHPLTGQLYVAERGDTQQAEIDVVDRGANQGWPCLEGGLVSTSGVAACLAGRVPDEVYANHPDWRRPIATHAANPVVTGLTAYTGLAYPDTFYGDLFYLLRDSARIYRLDLEPPCFLPHPGGVAPVAFHDSTSDGDFTVNLDVDGDGDYENIGFPNLVAMAQAADPLGRQVLYVAGKQGNGNALTDDSVVFRIEYATTFTPYGGATGRVPDSCFSDGPYSGGGGPAPYAWENPFQRLGCLPPGAPCPGQPDGTPCDDGDPCNGAETCRGGVCVHGPPAADGTGCVAGDGCHAAGTCQAGRCAAGPPLPDGTPCPDADPCNGLETCAAGVCQPGAGPAPLTVKSLKVKRASGTLALSGSIQPVVPVAPESTDVLAVELHDGGGPFFSGVLAHPGSDPFWRRRGGLVEYADRRGSAGGLTSVKLRRRRSGRVQVDVRGRRIAVAGLDDAGVRPRLMVGPQCFTADLSGRCALDGKKLRCR